MEFETVLLTLEATILILVEFLNWTIPMKLARNNMLKLLIDQLICWPQSNSARGLTLILSTPSLTTPNVTVTWLNSTLIDISSFCQFSDRLDVPFNVSDDCSGHTSYLAECTMHIDNIPLQLWTLTNLSDIISVLKDPNRS